MKNSILVLVCVATLATMPGCFKDLSCSKKSNSVTPAPSTHVSTLPASAPAQEAPAAHPAPAASHPSSVPPVAAPVAKVAPVASTPSVPTKA